MAIRDNLKKVALSHLYETKAVKNALGIMVSALTGSTYQIKYLTFQEVLVQDDVCGRV